MQFIYDKNAKNELLKIEDENYNYIVKARRHKLDDILDFRNLEDDFLYSYKISQIDKKSLFLNLLKKEEKIIEEQQTKEDSALLEKIQNSSDQSTEQQQV